MSDPFSNVLGDRRGTGQPPGALAVLVCPQCERITRVGLERWSEVTGSVREPSLTCSGGLTEEHPETLMLWRSGLR